MPGLLLHPHHSGHLGTARSAPPPAPAPLPVLSGPDCRSLPRSGSSVPGGKLLSAQTLNHPCQMRTRQRGSSLSPFFLRGALLFFTWKAPGPSAVAVVVQGPRLANRSTDFSPWLSTAVRAVPTARVAVVKTGCCTDTPLRERFPSISAPDPAACQRPQARGTTDHAGRAPGAGLEHHFSPEPPR